MPETNPIVPPRLTSRRWYSTSSQTMEQPLWHVKRR